MTWATIRDALAEEIASGKLEAGDRLPTEPQLAARFGAGRHSVRRAVEALAVEGRVSVEQGRGTFVGALPRLVYAIGRRTRLRRNLADHDVTGELLGAERIPAPPRVRKALRLEDGALVVASRRITRADGLPIAFGTVHHDAARFGDIAQRRDVLGSTTEAYRSYGIDDYVRAETVIHARPARPEEARVLQQHPDMPVMVVRALDRELGGRPLSFSEVIWSAARVRFSVAEDEDDG